MSSADATASLVRALVERTVRGRRKDEDDEDEHDENDEEDRARRVDAGCRYAARVLGSTLGASTVRASSRGDRDGELGDCATRIARRARRRFGDAAATRAADVVSRPSTRDAFLDLGVWTVGRDATRHAARGQLSAVVGDLCEDEPTRAKFGTLIAAALQLSLIHI